MSKETRLKVTKSITANFAANTSLDKVIAELQKVQGLVPSYATVSSIWSNGVQVVWTDWAS